MNDLSGRILVASPILRDSNFSRTVLFISGHSRDEGAVGYILNRPTDSEVPLIGEEGDVNATIHFGGPVQTDAVTLASLQWREDQGMVVFHVFEGSPSNLIIPPEWEGGLRAFAGYSGWSPGQLEAEISHNAWVVMEPNENLINMTEPDEVWQQVMREGTPMMRLLAAAPDNPLLN